MPSFQQQSPPPGNGVRHQRTTEYTTFQMETPWRGRDQRSVADGGGVFTPESPTASSVPPWT